MRCFIPNPHPLISFDKEHFRGVFFPKAPPNEIIAKYPRQKRKTQHKAIKNSKKPFFYSEKQPFRVTNCHRQTLKITTLKMYLRKTANCRNILLFVIIVWKRYIKQKRTISQMGCNFPRTPITIYSFFESIYCTA